MFRRLSISAAPGEARAALEHGLALEAAGRHREAFPLFQRATELDPSNGRAWRHLGNLLRRAGQLAAASECFERAIASGDDRPLNEFFLSAVGVGAVVPSAPANFVRALFDQYADRFDEHLLRELRYRAPELLAALIARSGILSYETVLDLGCGTGLAGQRFRSTARSITGVDVSQRMLAQAGRISAYDHLVLADMESHLLATDCPYDLVLCCDAFIYIGNLNAVFAGVCRVLQRHGSFAFTVESCDAANGYELLPTLRYAHSEDYVRSLANQHNFEVRGVERGVLREENDQPIDGLTTVRLNVEQNQLVSVIGWLDSGLIGLQGA